MTEITEFDDRRSAEITIKLNDDNQVVGTYIYFCTPVLFHNFSFEKVGIVQGCGGCSEKGLPRNPSIPVPNPNTNCRGGH